jgi:hypothetical protein
VLCKAPGAMSVSRPTAGPSMQHLMIVRILHLLTGLSSHLEADETALGKTLKAPLAAICEWATKNGDVQP